MDASKTWPPSSLPSRFSALPLHNPRSSNKKKMSRSADTNPNTISSIVSSLHFQRTGQERPEFPSKTPVSSSGGIFSDLPFDILARLAAAFDIPELWAASAVCRQWREALRPLREAMVLLRWGKRFKHGRGVRPDPNRALECFLKGSERGSAAAMVDAGLMYWEMGRKEEGRALYSRAAELQHPAAQCNLGICFLEAEPEEAVKWFFRAAKMGNSRAQYSLALCLHKGRGVKCNLREAARWYLRSAEGGMYALCTMLLYVTLLGKDSRGIFTVPGYG
ncbi:F-box protein [Platanthera guangdongensis]|uniref:F-box protein n=1 Tax=Platanthera guangdongensis TaxID=2320717 RepID=A0ABR2M5U0_9ASPA